MSYRGALRVELATFTITNATVSTNYYTVFTTRNNNITGASISTDEITLPTGQYLVRGVVAGKRSSINDVLNYRFELDGTLVGSTGGLDSRLKTRVDDCKAQFSITAAQGILKLKIVQELNITANWTIEPDYSYIVIMRSF